MKREIEFLEQGLLTYWEKIAASRWGIYVSEIEKETILKAHQIIGATNTALEVGCEGGRWSKLLLDLGWNMICTDVDKNNLEICKNRMPTAKCILTNMDDKTLPSETASLSLILCIEVYPVIESEWFLTEAHRVLTNKGVVVGVFLNRHSLRGLFVNIREKLRKKDRFIHYQLSYSFWKKRMFNNNFRVLYERGFCWFPFPRASNSYFIRIFTFIESVLHLGKLVNISPWIIFIAQK